MKGASQGVARRYARALFEVAEAEGSAPALRGELDAAARALRDNPELRRVLLHPALNMDRKKAILAAVFGSASPLLLRALELLAARSRLTLLPAIAEEYSLALLAKAGVERAQLVSATPLAEADLERVKQALKATLGKDVELEASLDAELLGGLLVKIGGRHFDGSLRGRLRALGARLAPV
jgi:F-type H+-transporting ATPase subunit delta